MRGIVAEVFGDQFEFRSRPVSTESMVGMLIHLDALTHRFSDHFPPGHGSRLPPRLLLDVLHRAAVADGADIFKCL